MTFIKFLEMLRTKKGQAPLQIPKKLLVQHRFVTGQASLEYFVVFGLVAILSIASLSPALPKMQNAAVEFFQVAIGEKGLNVANTGVDGADPYAETSEGNNWLIWVVLAAIGLCIIAML